MIPATPIGQLVTKCDTWNPKSESSGEFTYIDLSSVDKDTKEITAAEQIACAEAPSRARQIVRPGDVLVATVRPNLNGVALVGNKFDGATASTGYCVLRPVEAKLDSRFLFHWVKTERFVDSMVAVATGANYPAVSDSKVKASTIPLPPLPEQKRIAGILDAADALRAKRRESLAQIDALRQSTFLDMFGDPVTNPMGWDVVDLASLVEKGDKINYGVVQPGDALPDGTPLVRVGDFVTGELLLGNIKLIAPAIENKYKRSRLNGRELLISCVGSIGTVCKVPSEAAGFNIARAVARVPLIEGISRDFMLQCLRSEGVQRHFLKETRTVSQPTLNISLIKNAPVIRPPDDLQQGFAAIVDSVEQQKTSQRAHLAELDILFASLQSRAFRGDL